MVSCFKTDVGIIWVNSRLLGVLGLAAVITLRSHGVGWGPIRGRKVVLAIRFDEHGSPID